MFRCMFILINTKGLTLLGGERSYTVDKQPP